MVRLHWDYKWKYSCGGCSKLYKIMKRREFILAGSKKADLTNKKVAVIVNLNNTIRDIHITLINSPAMMGVLAKSLMEAGIPQANFCIFDCARPFPVELKIEVRKFGLDQIVMLGKNDNPAVSEKTVFLSDNKDFPRDGKPTDQYPIPQLVIDADYLVNLHLVKMHSTGVTGAMKNLFGIAGNVAFHMHHKGPKNFPVSNHLPDLSLNPEIKQPVRLNIAEFIFGGHCPDTIDKFENEAFFPDGRPSSLIVSRSPFYHDTVLYGFIRAEYDKANPEKLLKDMSKIGPIPGLKIRHSNMVHGNTTRQDLLPATEANIRNKTCRLKKLILYPFNGIFCNEKSLFTKVVISFVSYGFILSNQCDFFGLYLSLSESIRSGGRQAKVSSSPKF
jgi:hypothetical protein